MSDPRKRTNGLGSPALPDEEAATPAARRRLTNQPLFNGAAAGTVVPSDNPDFLIGFVLWLARIFNPEDEQNSEVSQRLSEALGFENTETYRDWNRAQRETNFENARETIDPGQVDIPKARDILRNPPQSVRPTPVPTETGALAAPAAASIVSAVAAAPETRPRSPEQIAGDTYERFKEHLLEREGYRNTVYLDSLGKPTVGVGHLIRPGDTNDDGTPLRVGDRISDERVREFLDRDARDAFEAAEKQAAELGITESNFIIALGSVNYQLGTGWRSKFPNTWQMMENGQLNEAANALEGSLWNRQTPVRVDDFQAALRNTFIDAHNNTPTQVADNTAARPGVRNDPSPVTS